MSGYGYKSDFIFRIRSKSYKQIIIIISVWDFCPEGPPVPPDGPPAPPLQTRERTRVGAHYAEALRVASVDLGGQNMMCPAQCSNLLYKHRVQFELLITIYESSTTIVSSRYD